MGKVNKKKVERVVSVEFPNPEVTQILDVRDKEIRSQRNAEKARRVLKKTSDKRQREVARRGKSEERYSRSPKTADHEREDPAEPVGADLEHDTENSDFEVSTDSSQCSPKSEMVSVEKFRGVDEFDQDVIDEILEDYERGKIAENEESRAKTQKENVPEGEEVVPRISIGQGNMIEIKKELYEIITGHSEVDLVSDIKEEPVEIAEGFEIIEGGNDAEHNGEEANEEESDNVSCAPSDGVESMIEIEVEVDRNSSTQGNREHEEEDEKRGISLKKRKSQFKEEASKEHRELRRPNVSDGDPLSLNLLTRVEPIGREKRHDDAEKGNFKYSRIDNAREKPEGAVTRSKNKADNVIARHEAMRKTEETRLNEGKRDYRKPRMPGGDSIIMKKIDSRRTQMSKAYIYDIIHGKRNEWYSPPVGGFGSICKVLENYSRQAQEDHCVFSPNEQKILGVEGYLKLMCSPDVMGLFRAWAIGLARLTEEIPEVGLSIGALNSIFHPRQTSGAVCVQLYEVMNAMGGDLGRERPWEDQSAYFISSLFNVGLLAAIEQRALFGAN